MHRRRHQTGLWRLLHLHREVRRSVVGHFAGGGCRRTFAAAAAGRSNSRVPHFGYIAVVGLRSDPRAPPIDYLAAATGSDPAGVVGNCGVGVL